MKQTRYDLTLNEMSGLSKSMPLYHGTSAKHLADVLANGLKPRGNGNTQWAEQPSRMDMVYMTTSNPLYFACNNEDTDKHKALLLEIDTDKLDENLLYPDEDFIRESFGFDKGGKVNKRMHKTITKTLLKYKEYWQESIEGLGNVAYRGIVPPTAITRYCIIDTHQCPDICLSALDACIHIIAYQICGQKYKDMVAWFFGDTEILPQAYEWQQMLKMCDTIDDREKAEKDAQKALEYWTKRSKDRSGIEVFENRTIFEACP